MEEKKYYSVEDLTQILCVNRDTIYRYISTGINAKGENKLQTYKIGRRRLVSAEELDRFIKYNSEKK